MPTISAPLFDLTEAVPFRGNTSESKQASASGAVFSLDGRKAKTARYLELIRFLGPVTDQQIQQFTHWPLSSVCSIRGTLIMQAKRAGLTPPIVPAGHETVQWEQGRRQTVRTKWRLV